MHLIVFPELRSSLCNRSCYLVDECVQIVPTANASTEVFQDVALVGIL
jgi:hypothetical protein